MESLDEQIRTLKCEIYDIAETQKEFQEQFQKLEQVKKERILALKELKKMKEAKEAGEKENAE